MIRYHYQIRDAQSNVVHNSKDGVPGEKGFDSPIKASDDGELIMDMKYPFGAYYVHVYEEDYEAKNN